MQREHLRALLDDGMDISDYYGDAHQLYFDWLENAENITAKYIVAEKEG